MESKDDSFEEYKKMGAFVGKMEKPGKFQPKKEDCSVLKYFTNVQQKFYWQKIPPHILAAFEQRISSHMIFSINSTLEVFRYDPTAQVTCLTSALNGIERSYAHFAAGRFEIKTEVKGNVGRGRALILFRKPGLDEGYSSLSVLKLSPPSRQSIQALTDAFPFRRSLGSRNYAGLQSHQTRQANELKMEEEYWTSPNFKSSGSRMSIVPFPKIPPARNGDPLSTHRASLPVAKYRDLILQSVTYNQLTLITGNPGSGKTTQVPQYILDDATERGSPIRILCTLPERLSAIAMSDRVAEERGELLGHTVGYQIRLESRVSPCDTLLTYCTSGVMLRSLASPSYSILRNTTHLILDEIQERDAATDLLLTILREVVHLVCPQIRIILMGSDLDVDFLNSFMNGNRPGPCSVLRIENELQNATCCFLESIKEILESQKIIVRSEDTPPPSPDGPVAKQLLARRGLAPLTIQTNLPSSAWTEMLRGEAFDFSPLLLQIGVPDPQVIAYEAAVQARVDFMIGSVLTTGEERVLSQFIDLLLSQDVGIDATHSHSGLTMLMAYSMRGMAGPVECLLNMGANWVSKSKLGLTAEDMARECHQEPLAFLLESFGKTFQLAPFKPLNLLTQGRYGAFLNTVDEDRVDLGLIHSLLHFLHLTQTEMETILVLLPSYDDIFALKQLIFQNKILSFDAKSFVLHMLHPNVQSGDQKIIFDPSKLGVRKIVLGTSICDYVTLENVTHVIDAGKIQEQGQSPNGVTFMKSAWISKWAADMRARWTGNYRPSLVFRCYSPQDYVQMKTVRQPEILTAELQELCLHARSLLNPVGTIANFFETLPSPPPRLAVKRSVEALRKIGALDNMEQLTPLGSHLLDFHVEPRFAKALILAVVLRCLDPVLTIVAAISHRDPFVMPAEPLEQQRAFECKRKLSMDSFSDHMCILKAFQEWEMEKEESREDSFCSLNYIGPGTFEMIYGIRTELLGQLRASGFVRCKGMGDVKSLNYNSGNWAVVKGVLVSALYPNLMKVDHGSSSLSNDVIRNARFHPSSCIRPNETSIPLPSDWILYDEINQCGSLNLVKGCTLVSTAAVGLFGGNFSVDSLKSHSGYEWEGDYINECLNGEMSFKMDAWVEFIGPKADIEHLLDLRIKFRDLVLRQLAKPGTLLTQGEETTMQTIVLVLTGEDQAVGLVQVEGVGKWPRFAGGNLLNTPRFGFEKAGADHGFTPFKFRNRTSWLSNDYKNPGT